MVPQALGTTNHNSSVQEQPSSFHPLLQQLFSAVSFAPSTLWVSLSHSSPYRQELVAKFPASNVLLRFCSLELHQTPSLRLSKQVHRAPARCSATSCSPKSLIYVTGLTFIISLDNSLIVAWISGIFTRFCIAFMTSVLFCNEPATLRTAVKERQKKLEQSRHHQKQRNHILL